VSDRSYREISCHKLWNVLQKIEVGVVVSVLAHMPGMACMITWRRQMPTLNMTILRIIVMQQNLR